jgi:hypothetical protein
MAISLYDATVPNFLQAIDATSGVLDRGLAFFQEKAVDLKEIVAMRLAADMLPFSFQILSVAQHSIGAVEAVQKGVFLPPSGLGPQDYTGLQSLLTDARATLARQTPEAINACEGRQIIFQLGDRKLPFTTQDFLLSFSLPNFYFHATTAYDMLRMKGVPLGKRHFLGQIRLQKT